MLKLFNIYCFYCKRCLQQTSRAPARKPWSPAIRNLSTSLKRCLPSMPSSQSTTSQTAKTIPVRESCFFHTSVKYLLNLDSTQALTESLNTLFCSSLSQSVRAVERSTAGAWFSKSSLAQSVCVGPSAESGTVHGAVQTQRLRETRRACGHQGGRTHAEGVHRFSVHLYGAFYNFALLQLCIHKGIKEKDEDIKTEYMELEYMILCLKTSY